MRLRDNRLIDYCTCCFGSRVATSYGTPGKRRILPGMSSTSSIRCRLNISCGRRDFHFSWWRRSGCQTAWNQYDRLYHSKSATSLPLTIFEIVRVTPCCRRTALLQPQEADEASQYVWYLVSRTTTGRHDAFAAGLPIGSQPCCKLGMRAQFQKRNRGLLGNGLYVHRRVEALGFRETGSITCDSG